MPEDYVTQRELDQRIADLKELMALARTDDREAVRVALTSAEKLADKHNDLIRAGQERDAKYSLKTDLKRLDRAISHIREDALPSGIYEEKHEALLVRIDAIESWKDNVTGRVVGIGTLAVIFTAVSTAVLVHALGGG